MRTQADGVPTPRRRRSTRLRTLAAVVVALFLVLLTSMRGLAGFYTDWLWFDQLGFGSVWKTRIGTQLVLTLVFGAASALLAAVSFAIADRAVAPFRPFSPEEEAFERYRAVVGDRQRLLRLAAAVLIGIVSGPTMGSQWNAWLLYRHGTSFRRRDPQFGRDIGFYVFKMPFLEALASWAFLTLILITLVTALVHYVNGGIRLQAPPPRVSDPVRAQLSVLLALLALVRTAMYVLDRYRLVLSHRGYVDGAGYTDVKARLPAITLLIVISLAAAIMFVANIRRRGWTLPVFAVGLWLLVSIVVGEAYPRLIQAIRVRPSESVREQKYIARNIDATREAFRLNNVKISEFPYDINAATRSLATRLGKASTPDVRLWDPLPDVSGAAFLQQRQRDYFSLERVDIDRYVIDGKVRPVVIAPRELELSQLKQASSWVNRHLRFTHGYGLVMARADQTTSSGKVSYVVRDVPVRGKIKVTQPRVYFGENLDGFAIVRTKSREVDYPADQDRDVETVYSGKGGVKAGGVFRRIAFALRFGDANPLISSLVRPSSRVLYIRDVRERAAAIAPFLRIGIDPYPVVLDGKLVWVLDGFTTTTRYPYSQRLDDSATGKRSALPASINYVRNSVKIVIDAYDGTAQFYVVDKTDPIAATYRNIFPKLLRDGAQLDRDFPTLRRHFRYPEDLFRAQAGQFSAYHVTKPAVFYGRSDVWTVSRDPATGKLKEKTSTTPVGTPSVTVPPIGGTQALMDPTYVLMRLPGQEEANFVVTQAFVPGTNGAQRNLAALMIANSDEGHYGELQVLRMPPTAPSPVLVAANLEQDPRLSRELSLLDQRGSEVIRGQLQLLPIEKGLLFVRPLYIEAQSNPFPELKFVAVTLGNRVAFASTVEAALNKLVGRTSVATTAPPSTVPGEPSTPRDPTSSLSVDRLLDRAATAYQAGQEALKRGDLAGYQRSFDEVGRLLSEARLRATNTNTNTNTTDTASTSTTPVTTALVPQAPVTTAPAGPVTTRSPS